MPESNVLAMVSVLGSSTGGSAAPSQQTTTTKSRAMQASDKEAAYLQKYFDEHSATSEVRACSFLCSPLSVTRPAALVLCTSWLHQQIQQRSFAQDILKELIGAENVCTPKHLAALREKPDAAVAMVQSVHKSAYPPPAAKRGTEEFNLFQDVPPTKAARVGVTGASSDAANLQGETPPAPKTGGEL